MGNITIIMALLMGLTGSLHCAGMCGPIMMVLPFQMLHGLKKAIGITLYHIGRISVYALFALLLHSFRSLFQPQWQQYISVTLGAVLFMMGIISLFPNKLGITLPWTNPVKNQLSNIISKPGLTILFVMGMLNGMLPCGLVYMALTASITAQTATQAVSLMYAFGIGTIPMLVTISILQSKLRLKLYHIRKMVPTIMIVFGTLFVLRGMNLGIPYLSPAVKIEKNGIKSCCHPATNNCRK